ncbi:MAG: hypothetical protein ACQEUH_06935 [Pseudomonadota bacterium]
MARKVRLSVAAAESSAPGPSGQPAEFPIMVRVDGSRGGEARRIEIELPDDHVVEVELENGITLW